MREHIFAGVEDERDRQEAKFGRQVHPWPTWSAILTEECGEVAEACLVAHWGTEDDLVQLREELIQVAAVAVQMIEKIDAGEYPPPATRSRSEEPVPES